MLLSSSGLKRMPSKKPNMKQAASKALLCLFFNLDDKEDMLFRTVG
jgi:hypothetical protein